MSNLKDTRTSEKTTRSAQMSKVTGGNKKAMKEQKKKEFIEYCDQGLNLMQIIEKTDWKVNTIVIYMLETSRMPMVDGEWDRDEVRNHLEDIKEYDKGFEQRKQEDIERREQANLHTPDPDWWLG